MGKADGSSLFTSCIGADAHLLDDRGKHIGHQLLHVLRQTGEEKLQPRVADNLQERLGVRETKIALPQCSEW